MIVALGFIVMIVIGVVGSWHLRPSNHPRSIRKHDRRYRGRMWE